VGWVVWRILGISFRFHGEVHIWATMSMHLPWSTCSCSARIILGLKSIVAPMRAPTHINCKINIHMIPTIHCKYDRKEKDWQGFRKTSTALFTNVGSATLQTNVEANGTQNITTQQTLRFPTTYTTNCNQSTYTRREK
jgi:hypothetical protein